MANVSAEEEWRPITGYEGLYEVSNYGNVRSVTRKVRCRGQGYRAIKSRPRQIQQRGNGYLFVSLCKNGKHKMFSVHRLVADAFIPNPNKFPQVNHRDEDKTNNHVENLEWCTSVYNAWYGTAIARAANSESVPVNAYKDGFLLATFRSAMEAERMTGINHTSISSCLHGKLKAAGGYEWKFA